MSRMYGISFEVPDPAPSPAEVIAAFPAAPGLYVHIPFCRTICPFCPYNKIRYRPGLAAAYGRDLEREAAMYLAEWSGEFPSLYIGGGTPTLCLDELEDLLARIGVTGERAIEVLPDHMTPDGAVRLESLGFDFVSLGIQSFDSDVLQRLGRPGSPAGNRSAIETAIAHFACVDVDLIFDAAYQHPGVFLDDLAICFAYGAHQVSAYPLMRFGFTPFGKSRHNRRREHEVLREATLLAADHGYERRSVWTFNRRGSPSYTSITRPYYLGLGAGAASFAGRLFTVNHFGISSYAEAIASGSLPIARRAGLPASLAAGYRLFWQAYTGSIPLKAADPLLAHPLARALQTGSRAAGWLQRTGDEVIMTPKGYDRYHDLEQWVTYHFIEPLWEEMMREHLADGRTAAA